MADVQLSALQSSVLSICQLQPDGISDAEVRQKLGSDVQPQVRLNAYNDLLKLGRLRLASKTAPNGKSVILYQWVSSAEAEKFKGLNGSERMVYDLINKAGQSGLTKRDLKFRTNIVNSSELKQIAETLVARGLIKEIKSVQGTNKRVYIVSELEPSTLHTGGAWFNDEQEIDIEFTQVIYRQIRAYMISQEYVTVEQVTNFVAETKISHEDLSQNDIRSLMRTMLYDSVIEECQGAKDGGEYFRLAAPVSYVNQLSSVPCGSCPLFRDCTPGGVISPQTCVYMTEWLNKTADW